MSDNERAKGLLTHTDWSKDIIKSCQPVFKLTNLCGTTVVADDDAREWIR